MTRKFNCIFPRDPARRATEILKPSQQSQPYNSLQNERIQNEREEKSSNYAGYIVDKSKLKRFFLHF